MIYGLISHFYSSSFLPEHSKPFIEHASFTKSYSFIQAHFPHLGASCLTFTHIHTLESNLGFGILPSNNLTFRLKEQWMKPTTFQLIDDLLYLLSNSHPLQQLVVVCATQEETIHLFIASSTYIENGQYRKELLDLNKFKCQKSKMILLLSSEIL